MSTGYSEHFKRLEMEEAVRRPSHYSRFVIDPITFATANKLGGLELNAIKYLVRAPHKGKHREDLQKALRSVEMLIEAYDREQRIAGGETASDVWKEIL